MLQWSSLCAHYSTKILVSTFSFVKMDRKDSVLFVNSAVIIAASCCKATPTRFSFGKKCHHHGRWKSLKLVGYERACSRETLTERQRESWCNCVIAASASSQGCWRRRDSGMERWKTEQGDEIKEQVQGQADLWVSVSESGCLQGLDYDEPIWSSHIHKRKTCSRSRHTRHMRLCK